MQIWIPKTEKLGSQRRKTNFRVLRRPKSTEIGFFTAVTPTFRSYRPTLIMGAFGILFCNDFKRPFYFFFHTAVCFAPVHHDDEKEKKSNSFQIVPKLIPNAPIRVGLRNPNLYTV